jgi:hypothetical protein
MFFISHSLVKRECDPMRAYIYVRMYPHEVQSIPKSAEMIPQLGVDNSPAVVLIRPDLVLKVA